MSTQSKKYKQFKLLHLDIETFPNMGYVWSLWNQNVSLGQLVESGKTASWAAKWHKGDEVYFDSLFHSDHETMTRGIYRLLDEADAVCHYNGKKFDMPILNSEFLKLGLKPPSPYKQIDLLHTVKQNFRLTSNKLDYVSQYLGFESKTPHTGFKLWRDCMNDDPEAWKLMREYNIQDVNLLEPLYERLMPWIKNHPNMALYLDRDAPVCPNCGSKKLEKRGLQHNATQSYQRYKCQKCGKWSRDRKSVLTKDKKQNIMASVN